MPKRDPALIPLTHDHHHALVQARRLIESADDAEPATLLEDARAFLRFYEDDTLLHFHEEEEVLFPRLLEAAGEAPPELIQVLVEHVKVHGLVRGLRASLEDGDPDPELMKVIGETLRAHVRFEESVLFPLIEATVPPDTLTAVSFAERQRG
jgi:hemerythrin-like domain-containing protein